MKIKLLLVMCKSLVDWVDSMSNLVHGLFEFGDSQLESGIPTQMRLKFNSSVLDGSILLEDTRSDIPNVLTAQPVTICFNNDYSGQRGT